MGNSQGRDNVKKRAARRRKTERLAAAKKSGSKKTSQSTRLVQTLLSRSGRDVTHRALSVEQILHYHSTIDGQHLARDIFRLWRRQKSHGAGDVIGLA